MDWIHFIIGGLLILNTKQIQAQQGYEYNKPQSSFQPENGEQGTTPFPENEGGTSPFSTSSRFPNSIASNQPISPIYGPPTPGYSSSPRPFTPQSQFSTHHQQNQNYPRPFSPSNVSPGFSSIRPSDSGFEGRDPQHPRRNDFGRSFTEQPALDTFSNEPSYTDNPELVPGGQSYPNRPELQGRESPSPSADHSFHRGEPTYSGVRPSYSKDGQSYPNNIPSRPEDRATYPGSDNRPGGAYHGEQPSYPDNIPTRPGDRPIYPGNRPSHPGNRPAYPDNRPSLPSDRPSYPDNRPSYPGDKPSYPGNQPSYPGNQPSYPGAQPSLPSNRPSHPGDQSSFPGNRPSFPGNRPSYPGSPDRFPDNSLPPSPGNSPSGPFPGQEPSEEGDFSAIPGEPDVDYPVLSEIPQTSFSCKQQPYPGYYADIEARCQVFHVCANNRTYDFLCPNGTIFHQQHLVCVWWNEFDCNEAPNFYGVNEHIYDESASGSDQFAPNRDYHDQRSQRPGGRPETTDYQNPRNYPGQPSQYPDQTSRGGQYPDQPPRGGQYPGQPPRGGQYPDQPPRGGQHPDQPPIGGQYPDQPPSGGQYPTQPSRGGQYPDQPPRGGQYPDHPPSGGQYPAEPPRGGQYPDHPSRGGQYPDQPPRGGQYPDHPPSGGQYPAEPPRSGQYPDQPPRGGQYPDHPPSGGQYPDQPSSGGPSLDQTPRGFRKQGARNFDFQDTGLQAPGYSTNRGLDAHQDRGPNSEQPRNDGFYNPQGRDQHPQPFGPGSTTPSYGYPAGPGQPTRNDGFSTPSTETPSFYNNGQQPSRNFNTPRRQDQNFDYPDQEEPLRPPQHGRTQPPQGRGSYQPKEPNQGITERPTTPYDNPRSSSYPNERPHPNREDSFSPTDVSYTKPPSRNGIPEDRKPKPVYGPPGHSTTIADITYSTSGSDEPSSRHSKQNQSTFSTPAGITTPRTNVTPNRGYLPPQNDH